MDIYCVYFCDLGWMDKGGPNGEHWPDGRYYIENRSEAKLFQCQFDAWNYVNHIIGKDNGDSFRVNWDKIDGVRFEKHGKARFVYVTEELVTGEQ